MKEYKIIKISEAWSTSNLTKRVELELSRLDSEGFEIVSVAFGVNIWWMPTAFITVKK